MKFTPKLANGDINISKDNPLKEAAWLVGGLLTILVLLYTVLGFVADQVAMHLPVKAELWIGSKISARLESPPNELLQRHIDRLIEALPANSPLHTYSFRTYLDESDEINALALPGGNIIVFKGLLQAVKSENELDMVLAHELGHFAHRDHLQAMGRSLLVVIGSWLLPGDQSSEIVPRIASTLERKYSQKQEAAADSWGLDLLNRRYGHVGGATDFFKRLSGINKNHLAYFFATHPHPEDRVHNLETLIRQNNYAVRKPVPF